MESRRSQLLSSEFCAGGQRSLQRVADHSENSRRRGFNEATKAPKPSRSIKHGSSSVRDPQSSNVPDAMSFNNHSQYRQRSNAPPLRRAQRTLLGFVNQDSVLRGETNTLYEGATFPEGTGYVSRRKADAPQDVPTSHRMPSLFEPYAPGRYSELNFPVGVPQMQIQRGSSAPCATFPEQLAFQDLDPYHVSDAEFWSFFDNAEFPSEADVFSTSYLPQPVKGQDFLAIDKKEKEESIVDFSLGSKNGKAVDQAQVEDERNGMKNQPNLTVVSSTRKRHKGTKSETSRLFTIPNSPPAVHDSVTGPSIQTSAASTHSKTLTIIPR